MVCGRSKKSLPLSRNQDPHLYTVDSAYRLMMGIRKSLAARVNLSEITWPHACCITTGFALASFNSALDRMSLTPLVSNVSHSSVTTPETYYSCHQQRKTEATLPPPNLNQELRSGYLIPGHSSARSIIRGERPKGAESSGRLPELHWSDEA